MKRKIAILLSLIMCMTLVMTGCTKSWDESYPYSKYDFDDLVQLNSYLGLEIDMPTEDELAQELSNQLLGLQKEFATTQEITDRAVAAGDTVVVDYEGTLDGAAYAVCTASGKQILIDTAKFLGFDNFKSQIIGATIGSPVNFTVTYPADYYDSSKIGKSVVITLTVKSISVVTLPELTDAFINEKSEGSYTTLADYTTNFVDELKLQAKKESAWSAAVQASPIKDYPQDEIDRLKKAEENRYNKLAESKSMTLSEYLTSLNIAESDYSTKLESYAKQQVGEEILLYAIAAKENITVSKDEYNKVCSEWESNGFASEEAFKNYYPLEDVITRLLRDKVLTKVADAAIIKTASTT